MHWQPRHTVALGVMLFLVAALAAAMAWLPLGWGLIDDSANLTWVRETWKDRSYLYVSSEWTYYAWFRPVYILYVYATYTLFQDAPKAFYLANLFIVLGCCLPWIFLMRRRFPPERRRDATMLYGLLFFAALPMYILLVHLSFQEKLIILFGGASLLCLDASLSAWSRLGRFPWALQTASLSLMMLGLWSKPSALVFAPWILVAILAAEGGTRVQRGALFLAWAAMLAYGVRTVTDTEADYPNEYWVDWIGKYTHPPLGAVGFFLFGLVAAIVIGLRLRREGAHGRTVLSWICWPMTLLAYIILVIPIGLVSYRWIPAMPMAMGTAVLLAMVFREKWDRGGAYRNAILALAVLGAVGVICGRAIPKLARHSEITPVVRWLGEKLPDDSVDVYVMEPAIEACGGLHYLSGRKQDFHQAWIGKPVPKRRPRAWLITRDEAPIAPIHQADFAKVVYQSRYWTIFERGPSPP